MPLYREIYKKHSKLPQLIKRQIKEAFLQSGNCMYIRYELLLQIICLQTFAR